VTSTGTPSGALNTTFQYVSVSSIFPTFLPAGQSASLTISGSGATHALCVLIYHSH
jgi:hypothetical protein